MATRAVPAPLAQLPNALTILRLALIPVFVVLVVDAGGDASWPAGIVFGVAGITDQVDGWLARRWEVESEFGKFADPLADRLMIDIAVILLFAYDRLPWPALVLIVIRDGLLVLGTPFALRRGYDFSVSFLGKAATWCSTRRSRSFSSPIRAPTGRSGCSGAVLRSRPWRASSTAWRSGER